MRNFMIFLCTNYYLGDQMKEDEIGSACGMYAGKRYPYKVLMGKIEGKRPLARS
jgi:hypothetical protein